METAGRPYPWIKWIRRKKTTWLNLRQVNGARSYIQENEREREITHNCAQGYLEMFIHENKIGDSLGPIKKERERERDGILHNLRSGLWWAMDDRLRPRVCTCELKHLIGDAAKRAARRAESAPLTADVRSWKWFLAASYRDEEPLIFARARSFFQPPLRKSRARPSSSLSIVGSIPKRISWGIGPAPAQESAEGIAYLTDKKKERRRRRNINKCW